jgi:hypothetical protein
MKSVVVAEIERIAGDRLTPAMREEIADRAIKIIDDRNNKMAMVALGAALETKQAESAKGTLDADSKEKGVDPLKGGFP